MRGVDGGHLLEDHRVVLAQVVGDALSVLVRLGVPELRRVVVRHVVVLAKGVVLAVDDADSVDARDGLAVVIVFEKGVEAPGGGGEGGGGEWRWGVGRGAMRGLCWRRAGGGRRAGFTS